MSPSYASATVEDFSTASTNFVSVPGAQLTFEADAGETWIIAITSALQSTAVGDESAEARYAINGEFRGLASGFFRSDRHPWAHVDFVVGTGELVTIDVELRASQGNATISGLELVAFPLPAGTDLVTAEKNDITTIDTANVEVASMTINTDIETDYLVIGAASANHAPGLGGVGVSIIDPDGEIWPNTQTFSNNRVNWTSFLLLRRVQLTAGNHTFSVRAGTGSPTAETRSTRLIAFSTEMFGGVESVESRGSNTVNGAQLVEQNRLVSAALAAPEDRIVFQNLTLNQPGSLVLDEVELRAGTAQTARFERNCPDACSRPSYGAVRAFTTDDDFALSNLAAGSGLDVIDSTIHVLTLP